MFPSFESFLEYMFYFQNGFWLSLFDSILLVLGQFMKKKILGGKSSNGLLSNKSRKEVNKFLLFVFRNVIRDLRGEMLMQLTYTA